MSLLAILVAALASTATALPKNAPANSYNLAFYKDAHCKGEQATVDTFILDTDKSGKPHCKKITDAAHQEAVYLSAFVLDPGYSVNWYKDSECSEKNHIQTLVEDVGERNLPGRTNVKDGHCDTALGKAQKVAESKEGYAFYTVTKQDKKESTTSKTPKVGTPKDAPKYTSGTQTTPKDAPVYGQ